MSEENTKNQSGSGTDAPDTVTRKTMKLTVLSPNSPSAPTPVPVDDPTVTRRTQKLQGLAQLAPAPTVSIVQPNAAPPSAADSDTRTRRTVKLQTSGNSVAAVKPLIIAKSAPAPAPAATQGLPVPTPVGGTATKRTQRLAALDTQDVPSAAAVDILSAPMPSVADTQTRRTQRLSAVDPAAAPAPLSADALSKPMPSAADTQTRRTQKLTAVDPAAAPAPLSADALSKPMPSAADTQTRRTQKLSSLPESPTKPLSVGDLGEDETQTRKAGKVEITPTVEVPRPAFKAANVDDTVKLKRPAPKPVVPGSVTPEMQGDSNKSGGIKLNRPTPVEAPAPAAPSPAAAEKPETDAAPPADDAENEEGEPRKRGGLKVNMDAVANLGQAPIVAATADSVAAEAEPGSKRRSARSNGGTGVQVFTLVACFLTVLLLIFVTAVAITDYCNIWEGSKIELPFLEAK